MVSCLLEKAVGMSLKIKVQTSRDHRRGEKIAVLAFFVKAHIGVRRSLMAQQMSLFSHNLFPQGPSITTSSYILQLKEHAHF